MYVFLMLFSIVLNYLMALLIRYSDKRIFVKNLWLIIAIGLNLGVLGYYKYSSFLIENMNSLLHTDFAIPSITLPIGISFFTFQAMSYVIDVYRHDGEVQRNILNVALYISLFPQLVAGPIVRYQTIAEQIYNRNENWGDISQGCQRFVFGLGKKVLLSNIFAVIADYAFSNMNNLSVGMAWLGAIAYMLQIYLDFSGYSDMAIGLGRMFGFSFLENFQYPYISRSITEFWRRWHISLSSWFRDYVYIPLGGNRKGNARQIFNLSLVWFLTGLWHGANWTFICWGIYYLFFLILEKKIWGGIVKRKFVGHVYTLIIVLFGWVIFRAESLQQAIDYMKIMVFQSDRLVIDNNFLYYLTQYKWYLIIGCIACLPWAGYLVQKIKISVSSLIYGKIIFEFLKCVCIAGIFILVLSSLMASSYNPFIYFNF